MEEYLSWQYNQRKAVGLRAISESTSNHSFFVQTISGLYTSRLQAVRFRCLFLLLSSHLYGFIANSALSQQCC